MCVLNMLLYYGNYKRKNKTMNAFERISQAQYSKDTENFGLSLDVQNVKLPVRATAHSAGYDIFSVVDFVLKPDETIKLPTGLKVKMDDDRFLAVVPRSGLGFKYKLRLDNTVGIIDADYYGNAKNEGHIFVKFTNCGKETLSVSAGDAICQGIFLKYFLTDDDSAKGMRTGGLGSTGGVR